MSVQDLGTLSADGATTTYSVKRARKEPNSEIILSATGTFGGGTLTFQISFDGGTTWTSMGSDAEFTAAGNTAAPVIAGDSGGNVKIRGNLSGATTPSVVVKIIDNY